MKSIKHLIALVATIALCALAIPACQTTGDPGADIQGFWNSPAIQSELALIQSEAIAFLNNFITSQFGSRKGAGVLTANSPAIRATVSHLRATHPNVPESVLVGAAIKAASQ